MTSRGEDLQQQSFVILAQKRPMLSFTLCNILLLKLKIDQRAGRAPEPVWTQWRENAFLPPLVIEPRIPNRPACCVVTIIRCPLRHSACQADFSLRKAGFASRTVRVGFAVKNVRMRRAILWVILSLVSCHSTKTSKSFIYQPAERKVACHKPHLFREKKRKTVATNCVTGR